MTHQIIDLLTLLPLFFPSCFKLNFYVSFRHGKAVTTVDESSTFSDQFSNPFFATHHLPLPETTLYFYCNWLFIHGGKVSPARQSRITTKLNTESRKEKREEIIKFPTHIV